MIRARLRIYEFQDMVKKIIKLLVETIYKFHIRALNNETFGTYYNK